MAVRFGLPMNPFALLMETVGSSLNRSPPWQSAQLNPEAVCMSPLISSAGFCRSPSIAV